MTQSFTAFEGERRLVTGSLAQVALAIKRAGRPAGSVHIFSDSSGRPLDLDLRGSEDEIVARLPRTEPVAPAPEAAPTEPRGRGRPKLGVVAREVTLLPRHWEWLNTQPGGASVALRKLVDEARRISGDRDRLRAARDAAYHFMSAMAGDFPGFEEASRALFAGDDKRFAGLIVNWPSDVRSYIQRLATGAAIPPEQEGSMR